MRSVVLGVAIALSVAACGGQVQPTAPASVAAPSAPATSPAAVVATPTPAASPSPAPTPRPSPAPTSTPVPAPTPTATPKPTSDCLASGLAAEVTGWEGAAGHQIASVTLTNEGPDRCAVEGTPEVELVDANGGILIDSQTDGPDGLPHVAPGARTLLLRHGAAVTTLVDADNYCGGAPALPTTVAFVLPADAGRLVAAPGPGGDVPPCLRSPGSLGSIAMNGWVK